MSYTPRTDLMVERAPIGLRTNAAFEQSCDLCRQLERELNAEKQHITELEGRLRVLWDKLEGERKHYQDRIKRLEEAGDAMLNAWLMPEDSMGYCEWVDFSSDAKRKWHKAKEAKP